MKCLTYVLVMTIGFGVATCQDAPEINTQSHETHGDEENDSTPKPTTTLLPTTTQPDTTNPPPTTMPATTTSTSTPTTTKPSPTTSPPSVGYFYNVTDHEKNLTCIMIDGDFLFKIQYATGPNMTSVANIVVPKPSKAVNASGTCHGPDKIQSIRIGWGFASMSSSIEITFNQTTDGNHWVIIGFKSLFTLDDKSFPNSTDAGKTLISDIELNMQPFQIPFNHSLRCYSNFLANNVTSTLDSAPYPYSVHLELSGVQLQAFNMIPNEHDFVDAIHCDADKTSDIVPIAVGCALGVLVVIVIIAYVVGRRRRSGAYQSV